MASEIYSLRQACVVSDKKDLSEIYRISNFPVYMGVTCQESDKDLLADLVFGVSEESGCLQLLNLVDEKIVYMDAHGAGSIGGIWLEHHAEFSKYVLRNCKTDIVEIGGGHGRLSHNSLENGFEGKWTVFEPNPQCSYHEKVHLRKEFFTNQTASFDSACTVVHSHFFEHLYEPKIFLDIISKKMNVGSKMIFSIPNMGFMLKNNFMNMLNFEHTYFIDELYAKQMLNKFGFEIEDIFYFKDHSIFFTVTLTGNVRQEIHISNDLKCTYLDKYNEYFESINTSLSKVVDAVTKSSCKVYIFGAHVFTQYLLKLGVDEDKITYILDNDKGKHEQRLYGTGLTVKSPDLLGNDESALVITSGMGAYRIEVEKQLLRINDKLEFN